MTDPTALHQSARPGRDETDQHHQLVDRLVADGDTRARAASRDRERPVRAPARARRPETGGCLTHPGLLGTGAALAFAIALLASGFASSSVGTYAGQIIMSGFLNRSLPLALRRGITLAPALVVLFMGVDPTHALVWSQVVLSFGIPFALVPLIALTSNRTVMGPLANRPLTTVVACAVAALVSALNLLLIVQIVLG